MSREIKTKGDKGEGLSLICVNVKCYHYTTVALAIILRSLHYYVVSY